MQVSSYLPSLTAPYPLPASLLRLSRSLKRKLPKIFIVAAVLSVQPPQGFTQAGVSASAAVAPPSLGAKSVPARHKRPMFGAQSATRPSKAAPASDDALAQIKAALNLPPQNLAPAPFVGNLTTILASTANGLVVVRQPDCSLSAGNVPYSEDASDPYGMPVSVITSVDQLLHSEAGLTTTANFAGKCPDPTIGVNATNLLYVGTSTGGMRMAAVPAYNGTENLTVLYTFVIQANGTFGSSVQQTLPAGFAPGGVVAGDLNGDGNPDIIAVGTSGTTTLTSAITVLLGNADGTFTVGQSYTLGAGVSDSAVIDDFNGDGKLDVVVGVNAPLGAAPSGVLTFLPGNGDGTFGTPQTLPVTPGVENLVSGDFNGDGKKDVASGYGAIFLGNGSGGFQQTSTPFFTTSQLGLVGGTYLQVAAGDFNKDGKLDLAASEGNLIFIAMGNGDGTFTSGNTYAGIGNHGYITATDLDGDGNLDLYSGDAHAGVFAGDDFTAYEGYALMGRGDGTFVAAPQFNLASFNALENMNGQKNLGFVAQGAAANFSEPLFTTYYGNGDGTFTAAGTPLNASTFTFNNTQYNAGVPAYLVADLNGDGIADLYSSVKGSTTSGNQGPDGFMTALGTGNGSFATPTFTPLPTLVSGVGQIYPLPLSADQLLGTTNQNGKFEVVYDYVIQYSANNQNITNEGYATQVSNGDGTFAAPAVTVLYSGTNPPGYSTPAILSVADLNGDKIPDLITYTPGTLGTSGTPSTPATLQVMLGNANGTFGTAVNLPVISNPGSSSTNTGTLYSFAIGDLNGDGIPDVVAEGGSAPYPLGVALGKGDGSFNVLPPITLANADGGEQIAIGDFNGDGKADLATAGGTNGIFVGNGDGTFQSLPGSTSGTVLPLLATEVVTGQGPLAAYDLNGSGKIDLVAGNTFFLQTAAVTPPNTSATALTASASAVSTGQSVTLTATVTASSGSGTPTGTVMFLDGTASLGTGTLNASGVATFSTTSLAVGVQSLTATYGGDTNFSGSTSSAVTVTVTAGVATTTKLASSAASAVTGTSLTFSAVVSAASGSATPTGTVTFLDGATTLGTGTLGATGTATYATSALAVGTHSITASYAAAAGFAASTSSAVSVTITAVPATFSLGLSPATGTVSSGGSATTTITLTPAGGFSQAVSLACSGAPQGATCTISPASLTPSGSSAATAAMTISTASAMNRPGISGSPRGTAALAFLGGGAFLSFALLRRRREKLWGMQLGLGLVLLGATLFAGCGGGSGGNTGGTYTLTVTGTSGTLTQTTTYSLTVQ